MIAKMPTKIPQKKDQLAEYDEAAIADRPGAERVKMCTNALWLLFPKFCGDPLLDDYAKIAAFLPPRTDPDPPCGEPGCPRVRDRSQSRPSRADASS
jgi:hypothetical protein